MNGKISCSSFSSSRDHLPLTTPMLSASHRWPRSGSAPTPRNTGASAGRSSAPRNGVMKGRSSLSHVTRNALYFITHHVLNAVDAVHFWTQLQLKVSTIGESFNLGVPNAPPPISPKPLSTGPKGAPTTVRLLPKAMKACSSWQRQGPFGCTGLLGPADGSLGPSSEDL